MDDLREPTIKGLGKGFTRVSDGFQGLSECFRSFGKFWSFMKFTRSFYEASGAQGAPEGFQRGFMGLN